MHMQSFSDRVQIFKALLWRDMYRLKQLLRGKFIDTACVLVVQVIVFSKLFPLLGMPRDMVLPIYLGASFSFLIFFAYNLGLQTLFDLKFSKFIDYQLTLPLPKRWLVAEHLTYFIIESLIITIPLNTFGLVLIGASFPVTVASLLLFTGVYLSSLIFLGMFFLFLSFWYTYDFYTKDLWSRRLNPLFLLSANLLIWHQVYQFSPRIGMALLCNPFTYGAEGMRSALLGGDFIPAWICIIVLLSGTLLLIPLLAVAFKKRLDPV